jgi:hypothetical protein
MPCVFPGAVAQSARLRARRAPRACAHPPTRLRVHRRS